MVKETILLFFTGLVIGETLSQSTGNEDGSKDHSHQQSSSHHHPHLLVYILVLVICLETLIITMVVIWVICRKFSYYAQRRVTDLEGNVTRNPRCLIHHIPRTPVSSGRFMHRVPPQQSDRTFGDVRHIILPPPPSDMLETPNGSSEDINCKNNDCDVQQAASMGLITEELRPKGVITAEKGKTDAR